MPERLSRQERKLLHRDRPCPICEQQVPFLWTCPCGFQICDRCLRAEAWGYTCNNLTWTCPDCGAIRSF
jgi:hypothetical protein